MSKVIKTDETHGQNSLLVRSIVIFVKFNLAAAIYINKLPHFSKVFEVWKIVFFLFISHNFVPGTKMTVSFSNDNERF